jgi:hypothetical protein
MAWTSLKTSLGRKPMVLAGPILRKTTRTSVTVWLALKTRARVTLTITDEQGKLVMTGDEDTVEVGTNLHIVAVTGKPVSERLSEGVVYHYDLVFDTGTNSVPFSTATDNARLGYDASKKPSFSLPPADLNRLRILQGSCRMPHANGRDTLPLIDDLIATTASNAYARPHQLLMTGDQIYADDVSQALLLMLIEASDVLLGWTEAIPIPGSALFAPPLPAGTRMLVLGGPDMGKLGGVTAGFTSVDLHSHLMSLGEYLCMYLFVWSDVLWPDSLPTSAQVMEPIYDRFGRETAWQWYPRSNERTISDETTVVAAFAKTLWQVRRVLANVPSYMVFDDHEVTDDWNMTRNFCADVYGHDLGKRIVQNALVAYSLCQHWGNAPEQFAGATSPGAKLIALLTPASSTPAPATPLPAPSSSDGAARYDLNSPALRKLIGMHDFDVQKHHADSGNFHDPGALLYDYTVEGEGHQIVVTDTRSWRSYPLGRNSPGHLLPKDEITRQIVKTPALGNRLLIVVLSTNAPPVGPIRAAARHAFLAQTFSHYPDIFEAWEIPSIPFDRLLTALTEKLPTDTTGRHTGAVLLLSGDVHHSYASRLVFRAEKRFEAQPQAPATAVLAQLVASSFKKQTDDTIGFQDHGYTFAPKIAHILDFIPRHGSEGYVGWDVPPGTKLDIGTATRAAPHVGGVSGLKIDYVAPTHALQSEDSGTFYSVKLTKLPDYRYRLDYLTPTSQGATFPPGPVIAPLPAGASPADRKKAAQTFAAAHSQYRLNRASPGADPIIGVNNFSEITFDWGATADTRKVNHTLRWFSRSPPFPQTWTTYSVSLNPADTAYTDIKDGTN